MSIKISFKTPVAEKNIKNYVLFANENFEINGLSKLTLNKHSNLIKKTINSNKSKNTDFLTFNFNSNQKITLINFVIDSDLQDIAILFDKFSAQCQYFFGIYNKSPGSNMISFFGISILSFQ